MEQIKWERKKKEYWGGGGLKQDIAKNLYLCMTLPREDDKVLKRLPFAFKVGMRPLKCMRQPLFLEVCRKC